MITRLIASAMRRPLHHTLIFHRVLAHADPMNSGEPTAAWFAQLMKMLSENFEVIDLAEALGRASAGELAGPTVSITFDDGYADNYAVALPILQRFGLPATFFVASGFLDGGRMWNDSIIETVRRLPEGRLQVDMPGEEVFTLSDWVSRREAAARIITAWKHLPLNKRQEKVERFAARVADLPDDLMMTTGQLRNLALTPQVTIGGHTRTHPILATLPAAAALAEIRDGKADLENKLQRELTLFAYPNGKYGKDYREEHAALARRVGFHAAVATDWGTLDAATDPFAIPRFTPWHRNLIRFSVDLARCHYGWI